MLLERCLSERELAARDRAVDRSEVHWVPGRSRVQVFSDYVEQRTPLPVPRGLFPLCNNVSSSHVSQSHHDDVKDFSWIQATASPNWSPLEASRAVDWVAEVDQARKNYESETP